MLILPPKWSRLVSMSKTTRMSQDAIAQFGRAVDAATDTNSRVAALNCLGAAFMQAGDMSRAKMSYTYALQQNPDNAVALVGSGLLAERDGDLAAATTQISHAMKVEPTDVGYLLLEKALRRAGNLTQSKDALAQAQRISPNISQAQQSAAQILATAGIPTD